MPDFSDAPEQRDFGVNYDRDKIAADLADTAYRWVEEEFPNGQRNKDDPSEWRVADISGRRPTNKGSCVINLNGSHAGSWRDWSAGDHAKGGPISTIKERHGLHGVAVFEKCVEILHRMGKTGDYKLTADQPQPKPNGADTFALVPPEQPSRRALWAREEIYKLLLQATWVSGTIGERYCVNRAGFLPPAAFGPDPDLRFHPSAVRSRREAWTYAALIALFRWPNGARTGGLHETFLLNDGSGHIGWESGKPKRMLGEGLCGGAVIMLAPLDPAAPALGIGEGIETTLAGMRYYRIPGWACGSADGLRQFAKHLQANDGRVAVGPDGELVRLQRLAVWADRRDAGEKAGWFVYRVARALGIEVQMFLPTGPDDLADDLAKGLPAPEPQLVPTEKEPKHELPVRTGAPEIQVGGGRLPENVDDAELYLAQFDDKVFQRGPFLVRPSKSVIQASHGRKEFANQLVRISIQHMIDRLTRIINFQKYDARKDEWFSINCPADVAAALLERKGGLWPNLPHIRGIVTAPTLRWDGSLLNKPGYDPATGILFDPGEVNFDDFEIPLEPNKEQARAALNMLLSLIAEFPFVDEQGNDATGKPSPSRSVALSHMLTATIRFALQAAPMHGFSATAAGSGKSLLVDTSSMIATGHACAVISPGHTPEEAEKRLGAALLAGDGLISFDNCERALGGETLNQVLTQPMVAIRILGTSDQPTIPCDALISATGQNLTVIGDMTRRTITAMLDPKMERPETRTFTTENPVVRVRNNRALYVAASLVVLRAYHVAGRPTPPSPLGSFEDWSNWVRAALIWLGELDPCDTMERTRQQDPRRLELGAVLHQWQQVIGTVEVTAKRVIEYATELGAATGPNPLTMQHPEFREALLVVAGDKGSINSRRLGYWLRSIKGRVVDRMRVEEGKMLHGENRWRLVVL